MGLYLYSIIQDVGKVPPNPRMYIKHLLTHITINNCCQNILLPPPNIKEAQDSYRNA